MSGPAEFRILKELQNESCHLDYFMDHHRDLWSDFEICDAIPKGRNIKADIEIGKSFVACNNLLSSFDKA